MFWWVKWWSEIQKLLHIIEIDFFDLSGKLKSNWVTALKLKSWHYSHLSYFHRNLPHNHAFSNIQSVVQEKSERFKL
jgi:hypothetical protein